jgi:hypothetical protein
MGQYKIFLYNKNGEKSIMFVVAEKIRCGYASIYINESATIYLPDGIHIETYEKIS